MTLCPSHRDRNPSLRITPRKAKDPLFYCFAGCDQMAVIGELVERDLLPNRFKHRPAALRIVVRLRALLEKFGPGRAAATDRALMTAYLDVASRLRKSRYDASVRELAELSGLTVASVSRANRRLRRDGWLCRVGTRAKATPPLGSSRSLFNCEVCATYQIARMAHVQCVLHTSFPTICGAGPVLGNRNKGSTKRWEAA